MSDRVTELAMDSLVDTHNELMRTRAELTRLTALLEDREGIAKALFDERNVRFGVGSEPRDWEVAPKMIRDIYLALADRIRAYLKEQK